MSEQVKVDIQDNSPYRVALELAYQIAKSEDASQRDREYWLDLYARCRSVVVHGKSARSALEK